LSFRISRFPRELDWNENQITCVQSVTYRQHGSRSSIFFAKTFRWPFHPVFSSVSAKFDVGVFATVSTDLRENDAISSFRKHNVIKLDRLFTLLFSNETIALFTDSAVFSSDTDVHVFANRRRPQVRIPRVTTTLPGPTVNNLTLRQHENVHVSAAKCCFAFF